MGDLARDPLDQSIRTWPQSITAVVKTADRFLAITIQLALILFLISRLQVIDSPAFNNGFALLLFAGFVIHHLLPLSWRLPFFLLLSFGGIFLVLGLPQTLWLVGIGLLLVGLCHLPINYMARLGLIALVGLALGLARAGIFPVPWSAAIWPVLGAMFMFRLIVYLYYLPHQRQASNIWATLSYFFLLPNVLYSLFPIVDYNTYRRKYYKSPPYEIYQRGLKWMTLGVCQLILYRFINLYLTLAPVEVTSVVDLLQYLVTDFLLIFRIVGQFQLVIGILLLFGFDLPQIFDNFLLSDSFSDFWRRVNIYWKDFVAKLIFNPVYFRLRKRGKMVPLVVGTAVVFMATWFLHSYQWFWLRGSFLLTWPDISFWMILGTLALINSLREQQRRPSPGLVGRGLRIAGTFAAMTILWSLWNSPTFSDWFALWTLTEPWQFQSSDVIRLLAILTPLLLVLVVVLLASRYQQHQWMLSWRERLNSSRFQPYMAAVLPTAVILFLIGFFEPAVYKHLGKDAFRTIASLSAPALSRRDDLMLTRGYYEELANVNRFNTELWQLYQEQPADWASLGAVGAIKLRDDLLEYDLVPNIDIYYKRAAFSTNSWGMRDKEYTKAVPDNTCRMALIGGSIVMGAGVPNREVFESLLEDRLNEEALLAEHVEILNFSSGGYYPLHRLAVLELKAVKFNPDVAIFVGHPGNEFSSEYLVGLIRKGEVFPDEIAEIIESVGIQDDMSDIVIEKRLQSVIDEILMAIYSQFVQDSEAHGIRPIMILIPRVDGEEAENVERAAQLGQDAGFTVVDLTDVYAGYEPSDLWVAPWDHHPNNIGHALIAERLYQEIKTNPELASLCS